MNTILTATAGVILVVAAAGGITAILGRRDRRGSVRGAVIAGWALCGILGATLLTTVLAPGLAGVWAVGAVLMGCCAAVILVSMVTHRRAVAAARVRDRELGIPPAPWNPTRLRLVAGTGLVALVDASALIAPWMLALGADAGLSPAGIVPGMLADLAVAGPALWAVLFLAARTRMRAAVRADQALRTGIAQRTADATAAGYRRGLAHGRRHRASDAEEDRP